MEIIENNIKNIDNLTALQRAQKKYYEKMKNDPNYVSRRRARCTKYYNKIKYNDELKNNVSVKKKEYYKRKKTELLLEILLLKNIYIF